MGKYYGLINHTKNHKVSSCWENSPPSSKDIIQIAIIFGWDRDDAILAGSYADIYYYYIDKDGNVLCHLIKEFNNIKKHNIHITDYELLEDVYEYNVINANEYEDIEIIDSIYLKQMELENKCSKISENIKATLLSFDGHNTLEKYNYDINKMGFDFNKFPDWKITENGKVDNNTDYVFNINKFNKYSKSDNFNEAFFFN
jgi:hypothetical protein